MVASAVGSGAGVLSWVALGTRLEAAGVRVDTLGKGLDALVVPGVIGAAFGTPFGLAQWLALRRELGRAGWWVLATGLGYMAVFLVGSSFFTGENVTELGLGKQVLLGGALGAKVAVPSSILQWLLVLRGRVDRTGWWIVASILSWAAGFAISFALWVARGGSFFVIGLVVPLALTGLAMVWLLRGPSPGGANQTND